MMTTAFRTVVELLHQNLITINEDNQPTHRLKREQLAPKIIFSGQVHSRPHIIPRSNMILFLILKIKPLKSTIYHNPEKLQAVMSLKLASGSYDNTVRFWDPSNSKCNPQQIIKLDSAPICLEITQRKDKIIIGMNNSVKIFDISKPANPIRSFEVGLKGNVNAVGCFSKEDKIIYTACEDGGLRIYDLKSKGIVKQHKNNKPINCAALHPNQGSIVFGDEGGFVTKWDLYKDSQHKTTIESDFSIRTLTMSDTLQRMAFGDNEGFINLYGQHMTKKNLKSIKVHDQYILKVKISPNNRYLATCSADKKIKLFKISMDNDNFTITQHKTLKGHVKWVWDCQFSCDEAYLITCSTDMTIKLWDVEKGELVQTLKGHQKGVICLAINDYAQ